MNLDFSNVEVEVDMCQEYLDQTEVEFVLIIRSLFYQVTIPSTEGYAIFTNDYFVDAEGNVLTDTNRKDVYEYGDIIIQTSHSRYVFRKVYSAYDYAVRIMEYIKAHQRENVIYIDMAELNENWENHSGSFVVETLK